MFRIVRDTWFTPTRLRHLSISAVSENPYGQLVEMEVLEPRPVKHHVEGDGLQTLTYAISEAVSSSDVNHLLDVIGDLSSPFDTVTVSRIEAARQVI